MSSVSYAGIFDKYVAYHIFCEASFELLVCEFFLHFFQRHIQKTDLAFEFYWQSIFIWNDCCTDPCLRFWELFDFTNIYTIFFISCFCPSYIEGASIKIRFRCIQLLKYFFYIKKDTFSFFALFKNPRVTVFKLEKAFDDNWNLGICSSRNSSKSSCWTSYQAGWDTSQRGSWSSNKIAYPYSRIPERTG